MKAKLTGRCVPHKDKDTSRRMPTVHHHDHLHIFKDYHKGSQHTDPLLMASTDNNSSSQQSPRTLIVGLKVLT